MIRQLSSHLAVVIVDRDTEHISDMEDMEEDGDGQADARTSREYTSLEGVGMEVLSGQIQAQVSLDYSDINNDNDDDLANLERVAPVSYTHLTLPTILLV